MARGVSGWDLYRRIPADLTQATVQGGLLSVGCVLTMLVLFTMELWDYMSPTITADLLIDTNTEPMVRINFNITALDMPCQWISVDVKDRLGANRVDVEQNIRKYTLTANERKDHVEAPQAAPARQVTDTMESAMAQEGESPHLDAEGLKKIFAEKKFVFVDFYAPWCIWCKRLAPTWEDFAKRMHDMHYHTAVRKVDCTAHPDVCRLQRIRAFPTMRLFKHGHFIADFDRERTPEALIEWSASITGEDEEPHSADAPPVPVKGQNEEHLGCNLIGFLMVNRVPGNFHLNVKAKEHNINPQETNVSHVVHHLSFGDPLPPHVLAALPAEYRQRMSPLDHKVFISQEPHVTHDHFIKVVTTTYALGRQPVLGYQLQHSNFQYKFDEQHAMDDDLNLPEARFSYDLSPTAVSVRRGGRRWYEFLTNLCAIIGGVFTVMGLIDRSLHGIRSKVFKESVGKLG
eukprot:TRINITY_DN15069_c0_g1_i1.p1 TRINITY_DN15069_c0_g1~~TRINITY_DN15069_c0_g1_i1.p1  ORF type:complete len:486 (+),score=172.22 TRINITY_DN15069_c0_g1_i1:84-1460(+)